MRRPTRYSREEIAILRRNLHIFTALSVVLSIACTALATVFIMGGAS